MRRLPGMVRDRRLFRHDQVRAGGVVGLRGALLDRAVTGRPRRHAPLLTEDAGSPAGGASWPGMPDGSPGRRRRARIPGPPAWRSPGMTPEAGLGGWARRVRDAPFGPDFAGVKSWQLELTIGNEWMPRYLAWIIGCPPATAPRTGPAIGPALRVRGHRSQSSPPGAGKVAAAFPERLAALAR